MSVKKIMNKSGNIIAGIMFFVFLGLVGFFTIAQTRSYGLKKGVHIPVLFKSAAGLKVGATVMVTGVAMGVLSSLHYARIDNRGRPIPWTSEPGVPAASQRALAIIDLYKDIPIYPGYKIITRFPEMISQKVIEIIPGRRDPNQSSWINLKLDYTALLIFKRTGRLPTHGRNSATLLTAENFDDPKYQLASLIHENSKSFLAITKNMRSITHKINRGNGTMSALINSGGVNQEANELLRDLIILLQVARDGLEDIRESEPLINLISILMILGSSALGL